MSSIFLCFSQQSISNPVTLGSILVGQTNLNQMTDLCNWYQLTEQPSEDGFHVYRQDDGTLIKFKMSDDNTPYVEIQTTQSKKKIEKSLTSVGFQKDKDLYIKGSIHAIRYATAKIHGNRSKRVIFTIQDTTKQ